MRINGVQAAHVLGGSFTYANNPEEDQSLNGTPYASGFLLDQDATASGSMRLRYVDETYFDLMTAGDPVAMELEFASSAAARFAVLRLVRMRVSRLLLTVVALVWL